MTKLLSNLIIQMHSTVYTQSWYAPVGHRLCSRVASLLPFSICIIIITLWTVHDYVTGGSSTKGTPGPLLFCNIIHPVLSSPGSALQIGYTNDITQGAVTKDVQKVMNVGQQTGLNVNVSKCELVTHPGCFVTHPTLLSFPTNFWSSAISPHGSWWGMVMALWWSGQGYWQTGLYWFPGRLYSVKGIIQCAVPHLLTILHFRYLMII